MKDCHDNSPGWLRGPPLCGLVRTQPWGAHLVPENEAGFFFETSWPGKVIRTHGPQAMTMVNGPGLGNDAAIGFSPAHKKAKFRAKRRSGRLIIFHYFCIR